MQELSKEVWVFIEQHGGKPADVGFELLSKGRKLAEKMNGSLKAVVIGHNVRAIAERAFEYGAAEGGAGIRLGKNAPQLSVRDSSGEDNINGWAQ